LQFAPPSFVVNVVLRDGNAFTKGLFMRIRLFMAMLLGAMLAACGGSGTPTTSVSAGSAQNVLVGSTVVLSGKVIDAPITELRRTSWKILSAPPESKAALSNANALLNVSFTADVVGTYEIQLTGDFQPLSPGASAYTRISLTTVTATASAPATPVPPIAHAGPNQVVKTKSLVTLDGSASSDANGDLLKPTWTLSSLPAGSTAVLSGANSLHPSFVADLAGTYVASLVISDGALTSNTASVSITAETSNAPPVAHAGPAQKVTVGTQVTLDGSASSDADGDPLTAHWTLPGRPEGSQATLASPNSFHPSFTADVAGSYTASLIVNDGQVDSEASSVTITAAVANVAPIAKAGPRQVVLTGAKVTLDGSASTDANDDPLSAQWLLTSKPSGSTAILFAPNTFAPSFVADMEGDYTISLVVNDGRLNSTASTVSVTAITPTPSCPPASSNCGQ
jgi:hypothetical protein